MEKTERPQCRQIIHGAGSRRWQCGRRATGQDGYCGHCRNTYHTPRPYTCLACWTPNLVRGVDAPLCVDHKRPGPEGEAERKAARERCRR